MSQCFTCDYELRGYMAMGKQVLTLTYTHAIPFGNLRFQRLSHSTKITNTSSRDMPLAYVKSYVLMFLCPINNSRHLSSPSYKKRADTSVCPYGCFVETPFSPFTFHFSVFSNPIIAGYAIGVAYAKSNF